MGLRLDKFTIAIIALVAILLAVAVFTVNRTGGPSMAARTDDSPEATQPREFQNSDAKPDEWQKPPGYRRRSSWLPGNSDGPT